MANEVLQKALTAIVLADTTDYVDPGMGVRTDQIDLTSLASGAARQSDKVDLLKAGAELPTRFAVFAAIEIDVAPVSGGRIDILVAPSPDPDAGDVEPGGVAGADGAYTGTAGDSLDDSLKQLDFIGALVATSDAAPVVQYQFIGWYVASMRHATVIVDNNTDQALEGDAIEMAVLFLPYVDEIQ